MTDTNQHHESTRALHTDLYQLTMAVGYLRRGIADTRVVCEAFVRRLPRHRSFLLVAGLARIVELLRQGLRFTPEQIAYLESLEVFRGRLDDELKRKLLDFRFEGDLWAIPEGTVAFANEPLLRVEAPLWQAQLVETGLLSILNHATLVATKAARIVAAAAAGGAGVMEFGTRRTSIDAAVDAARAAYIAGCVGTSNVEAGFRHGIPIYGTMAHMWTMVHRSEAAAFDSYLAAYPGGTTLLVDTYGTVEGTRRACAAARRAGGPRAPQARRAPERSDQHGCLAAVRVDSELFDDAGRPSGICRRVREILDGEGFTGTRIVVSDDMNEERIAALLGAGEPIDAFGVGTELVTSKDAPALGGVYKVVWVGGAGDGRPAVKLSPGKVTYPGAHQILREHDDAGRMARDTLALADEALPGTPLLEQILEGGQLAGGRTRDHLEDLESIRARARAQLAALPRGAILQDSPALEVAPSARLRALQQETEARLRAHLNPNQGDE
jgi:nicotinate phosphoribosyltransferase